VIRRRPERLTNFRAGVLALAVLVLAVYFAWTRFSGFDDPYQLKAVFSGAPEVHSRTPVRIAGVDVGRVDEVERGPGNAATVTLQLEPGALPIHRDATAKIRTRLFLEGNFFVDLHPGTPSAPELPDGGTVPLSHTAVPAQLDQILSDFTNATREDVKTLVQELGRSLDRGGARSLRRSLPHLRPAFAGLAVVSEALRGSEEHDLPGAIHESEKVAAAIDSREAALPDLVTGLNRTARALAVRRSQLEASLPELAAMLREAQPALAEVRRLTPTARAFVRELRPGIQAAAPTLRLAAPFLTEADRLVRLVPALSGAADPSLASLARLQPGLTRVLRLVTPVTECLRRNAIPTLKTKIDDPPHSTGDPVYLDLVHSLPGQASASQNFDGNGVSIRYHVGFGGNSFTFGPLPGTTEPITGTSSEPIIGSRPRLPDKQPPFRPSVACVTQQRPNLAAETGPAPTQTASRSRPRLKPTTPSKINAQLRRRARAFDRRSR
jgi:phospholipid/cholesterol/gamma-HCH transport system substrate-binding protein